MTFQNDITGSERGARGGWEAPPLIRFRRKVLLAREDAAAPRRGSRVMWAGGAADSRVLSEVLSHQGQKKATPEIHRSEPLKWGSFHDVRKAFRNTSGSVRQAGERRVYFSSFCLLFHFFFDQQETLRLTQSVFKIFFITEPSWNYTFFFLFQLFIW